VGEKRNVEAAEERRAPERLVLIPQPRSYMRASGTNAGGILLNTFRWTCSESAGLIMHYDGQIRGSGWSRPSSSRKSFLVTRRRDRAYGRSLQTLFARYFESKRGHADLEDAYIEIGSKMLILDLNQARVPGRKTDQHTSVSRREA